MSSSDERVTVLVEVDVATARPPRTHARTYTWLSIAAPPDRKRDQVQIEAEFVAMHMAMCHPHVVMVVGARVIDWKD